MIRRLSRLLPLFILGLAPFSARSAMRMGDANGNGQVQLNDAVSVQSSMLGIASTCVTPLSAVSDDAKLDIKDVMLIAQYVNTARAASTLAGPDDVVSVSSAPSVLQAPDTLVALNLAYSNALTGGCMKWDATKMDGEVLSDGTGGAVFVNDPLFEVPATGATVSNVTVAAAGTSKMELSLGNFEGAAMAQAGLFRLDAAGGDTLAPAKRRDVSVFTHDTALYDPQVYCQAYRTLKEWVDATAGTTFVPTLDGTSGGTQDTNDGYYLLTPPFAINYFAESFPFLAVSVNGLAIPATGAADILMLNGIFLTSPFDYPSFLDPNRDMGVFYSSLYFRGINPFGAMYHRSQGSAPNRRYTVQWSNMASSNDVPAASRLTFQIIIEENGVIRYQYEDLLGNAIPPAPAPHLGNAAAIGMEDGTGTIGINWGGVFTNKIYPNQALLFTPCNCGNNVLDIGETCDDGNAVNDGNGCSEFCQIDGPIDLCPDGFVNVLGEICDDGNFSDLDNCLQTCLPNACGDGHLDLEAPGIEACDDGNPDNNDNCLNSCVFNVCGDGFQDLQSPNIEPCDDGNGSNLDDCLNACEINVCGDGYIDQQGPVTEFCDDGINNGAGQGFCIGDCSAVQGCGDGIVQGTEQCDDQNLDNNDDCLNSCAFNVCGDGYPDLQAPVVEECDDGNASNQDDCLNACLLNTCGDGFLDLQGPVIETCDDGNLVDTDNCPTTCVPNFCGDGFQDLELPAVEGCDDGNTNDCDGCRANCSAPETGCGDGFVCGFEICDDSNTDDCDGCRGDCSSFEFGCGDGYVCGAEVCDDFNTQDCDGCKGDCSRLDDVCGDMIVDAMCGEQCDDGNTADGDGCDMACYFGCMGPESAIFSDSFDDGDESDWTHTDFNGTADLWHVTLTDNAPGDVMPDGALWYGDEITGNFNFGDQWVRTASPSFALPSIGPGQSLKLRYWDRHQVEGNPYDLLRTGLLLPAALQLRQTNGYAPDWHRVQLDVSAQAGSNVQAYFEIDTVDDIGNSTFGWKVDAVEVLQCSTCGNNNLEISEECDDGNQISGDGCSSVCLTEATGCTGIERGFFGGSARDVAYFSNRAYVAMGERGLAIWNVTTPSNPVLLGRLDLPDYAQGVAVGSIGGTIHAFIAAGDAGVHVINCANPAAPVLATTFDTSGYARNVFFGASNRLYVADGAGLTILDVAVPASTSLLSFYPPADYATDVVVVGNYAYVAAEYAGLKVVDVSNPVAPNLVATPGIGSDSQAIAYESATNEIHIGDQNEGWIKININNPLSPNIRWINPFVVPLGFSFNGTTGYVAEGGNGLGVYNVPSGAIPASLQGNYDTQGTLFNVSSNAAMVYGADAEGGLVIVNASVPATPTLTARGATLAAANDLLVDGTTLWVGDSSQGVSALDISTPTLAANPALTAQLGGFPANRIDKAGNYVYAAAGGTGLNILDVSALPTLTLVGNYNTTGFSYDVKVIADVAYVADGTSGLVTVDVTAPGAPALLGQYNTNGSAFGVAVAGSVAYVADGNSGLVMLDISTPAAPSLLGTYNTPSSALDVVVDGIVAFVADNTNGVVAINVANPAAPSLVSTYNTAGNARGLTLSGNLLYVSDTAGGIVVLDVTDPASMTPQGGYTPKGIAYGTAVAGGYLYGATYYAGVTVVDGLAGVCGACGNLVVESPEQCDDGNNMGGDGCSADCLSDETCGNGVTDAGEACDDGWLNGYGEGYCLTGCVGVQTCGDGATNGTEICDDSNTADCDGCRGNCLAVETGCGDNFVCGAEACDDGNTTDCDGCRGDCSAPETGCGDGFTCGVEVCDDGNTDNCVGACRGDCAMLTACGDTVVCAPETCEDGNVAPFDGCDSCQLETPTCQPTNVAIFRDSDGWNPSAPNETILANAAIPYTVFGSSSFGVVNLAPFDKVIIANEQPFFFYSALMANIAWLDTWVANGGVLEFHAARNDNTIDGFMMPGGWATTLGYSDLVNINLPNHPAMRLPTSLVEADLESWGSSLHGAITTIPGGATTYLSFEGLPFNGLPAAAVIPHGSGYNLVSMQTLECAAPGGYCYFAGNNRGEALRNLVLYMPQQSCNCGNGMLDPGETCDDGASNGLCGFCSNGCKGPYVNTCQDGQVCEAEPCDDGNYVNTDDCKNTCEINVCGDGVQDNQGPATEACDDGNTANCDGCRGDCSAVETGCGDTFVCGAEVCDDGNTSNCTGACRGDCGAVTGCGDSVVCAPEQCDDANGINNDGCNTSCQYTPVLSVHSYAISGGTAGTRGYQDGNIDAGEAGLSIKVRLRNTGQATAVTPTATTSCPNCASSRFSITNGNLAWPNIAPGAIVESTTHITGSGITNCNTSFTTFTETVSANSLTWNTNTTFTTYMRPTIKVGIIDQTRNPSATCWYGGNDNAWSNANTNLTNAQSGRYNFTVIRDEICSGGTQNGLPCTVGADKTACTSGGGVCLANDWTDDLNSASELYYFDTLIFPDNGIMDAYNSSVDWWFREGKNLMLLDSGIGSAHCNNWMWDGVSGNGYTSKWNYDWLASNEDLEQYLYPFYSAGFANSELMGDPGLGNSYLIRSQLAAGTVAVSADTGNSARVRVAYRDVPGKGRVTSMSQNTNTYGSYPLRDELLRAMASSIYMDDVRVNTGPSNAGDSGAGHRGIIVQPKQRIVLRDIEIDLKSESICAGGFYNGIACSVAGKSNCENFGICSYDGNPCSNIGGPCGSPFPFGICGPAGTCPLNTAYLYVYSSTDNGATFTNLVYQTSYSSLYNDGSIQPFSAGRAAGSPNVLNLTLAKDTYYVIGVGWSQTSRFYYNSLASSTTPAWSNSLGGWWSGTNSLPSAGGSTTSTIPSINLITEELGCYND